ncbi:MAG: glycosyltransferase family 4 protein [Elusimicrobia bacterium]|nr:glycosyltransferase family 4 protein [Elusimicrobiota bacterium]
MPSKLKILHLDTGNFWRGGQQQVFLLARELKKAGLSQKLLSPASSPLAKKAEEEGLEHISWDAAGDLDLKAGMNLRKIIKAEKPSILHLHTARALGVASWSLWKYKKLPKIFTRRVNFPMKKGVPTRFKYSTADKIVAISLAIQNQLLEFGIEDSEQIYSCVDTEMFYPRSERKAGKIRIGMAGAIGLDDKDYITFVDTARILKDSGEDLIFEIAGAGRDKMILKKYIEDQGLSNRVIIRGFLEDMPAFFTSLDILLHTVHYEGLGTSILQAFSSGLPVVATSAGGIPEIVDDGRDGYLIPVRDPQAAADQLKILIDSPEKRERFAEAGREKVLNTFSTEVSTEKYLKIYESFT